MWREVFSEEVNKAKCRWWCSCLHLYTRKVCDCVCSHSISNGRRSSRGTVAWLAQGYVSFVWRSQRNRMSCNRVASAANVLVCSDFSAIGLLLLCYWNWPVAIKKLLQRLSCEPNITRVAMQSLVIRHSSIRVVLESYGSSIRSIIVATESNESHMNSNKHI